MVRVTAVVCLFCHRPIVFKIENLKSCRILIGEPGYEWAKPPERANWKKEMDIKVNGKPCPLVGDSGCKIQQDGYLQTLLIDAKKVVGESCTSEPVLVSMEIKPVPDSEINCNSECKPDRGPDGWMDYSEALCRCVHLSV